MGVIITGRRLDLHEILATILGSRNVYFQPPATVTILYPCIIYHRSQINIKQADDSIYKYTIGYMVTVIDQDPDSLIPEKLLALPLCRFDRHYTADNLNHDVFTIYY
jgi:hypothetical protein